MNKIWISTGHSREETHWKNIETTWDKFAERLRSPVITKETYAQYVQMEKAKQLAIKDVGGFVGGVIRGGRRIINSCTSRYLITLDVDEGSNDFIEDVSMLYGNAMVITSTHKHSTESPRYRLIMPLEHEVLSDEYEAIARRIAGNIGIELFDPTTFQPERLMFWPSRASDGEYVYWRQDGDWINGHEVLTEYADWKDTTLWPVSIKAAALIKKGLGKQENPTLKGGQIGVFCRSYTITEAIKKFLPDVYLETVHDNRYTYSMGSTAAGVIVYDDMFSYSHHSTDPTMGRLCNAFDLVRIHLYGDLDEGIADGMPANKKPSFVKMTDMIAGDSKVVRIGVTEQLRAVGIDGKAVVEGDLDWTEKLKVDKKGTVLGTIENCVIILNNDDNLKNCLSYDDFEKRPVLQRDLPWRKIGPLTKWLMDSDDASYRNYFEHVYKITSASKIADAMNIVIMEHSFHPVRDYLNGLEWDGVHRVDEMLIRYMNAEDSVYVRTVTKKALVAAVARVFMPGVKYDYVLTLKGPQGAGKSRLIKKLGGKWYSDTFGNINTNQSMENIQGVWLMEIGELAGFKRADLETIKLFVAKDMDRFRVAYGKRVDNFARQCIFIGTTNADTPLHDTTGGRRFWIVEVEKMQEELEQWVVDQIWAEATDIFKAGEDLFLTEEIEAMAKVIQSDNTEMDGRAGTIHRYLESKLPATWPDLGVYERRSFLDGDVSFGTGEHIRTKVTLPEIWTEAIRGKEQDMTPFNTKFIREIMNHMPGWKPKMLNYKPWGHQRGWEKVGVFEGVILS